MAREKHFIRGDNIDAKISSINKALNNLARRNFYSATVIMPKIPLSGFVQTVGEDGIIGRFLLPLAGYIRKAYMYVDAITNKAKPRLSVTLHSGNTIHTEELLYRVGPNTLTCDIPVAAGARLTLTTSDPESISGVSVGIVFEVAVDSTVKEKLVRDDILATVEAKDANETEG